MCRVMSLVLEHKRRHHASLQLSRNPPATEAQIDRVFESCPARPAPTCPEDLRAFLTCCNGLRLGATFETQSTEEMLWLTPQLLTIHGWGNGGFDCVRVRPEPRRSSPVVHVGHDPNRVVQITSSLDEWLMAIYLELATYGDIDPAQESSAYRVLR